MDSYTCDLCEQTFINRSNEGCDKEQEAFLHEYPEYRNREAVLVCKPCYVEAMRWFRSLSKEDQRKMALEEDD